MKPCAAVQDALLFVCAAAAQQEDEEDMEAAQEVGQEEMGIGTLLITHLTHQDLRSMEVLLPRDAVLASIPAATTQPLIKFKVYHAAATHCNPGRLTRAA